MRNGPPRVKPGWPDNVTNQRLVVAAIRAAGVAAGGIAARLALTILLLAMAILAEANRAAAGTGVGRRWVGPGQGKRGDREACQQGEAE